MWWWAPVFWSWPNQNLSFPRSSATACPTRHHIRGFVSEESTCTPTRFSLYFWEETWYNPKYCDVQSPFWAPPNVNHHFLSLSETRPYSQRKKLLWWNSWLGLTLRVWDSHFNFNQNSLYSVTIAPNSIPDYVKCLLAGVHIHICTYLQAYMYLYIYAHMYMYACPCLCIYTLKFAVLSAWGVNAT